MRVLEAIVPGDVVVSIDTDDILDHLHDPDWSEHFCLAQCPDVPEDRLVCYLPKDHESPWHIDTDLKTIRWAWTA